MGRRINTWIQRLIVPTTVLATLILLHLGLGVFKILLIVLSIFCLLMALATLADPSPRARGFMEGLRNLTR